MKATTFTSALLLVSSVSALPLLFNESEMCDGGHCEKPEMKYETIVDVQPGYQWDDAGGYCGSWASQRAFLSIGAWISQQQVRDHTSHCIAPNNGGHDSEILSCNIEAAWSNLKIDFEAFDYNASAVPQSAAYNAWLKKHLVQGRVVAWMIMWSGQSYPIYNFTAPKGMYGHVEPVVGMQSNHPLTDATVYDDDVVLHYTDGGTETVHRLFSSLPGKWPGGSFKQGDKADCSPYKYCIGNPYGFGWAATGFTHDTKSATAAPALLHVDPYLREPDTRKGAGPEDLIGSLEVSGLTVGTKYDIYRWDTVTDAFTYTTAFKRSDFTATAAKYTYADDKVFKSDGTTYYRVVPAE